MVSVDAFPGLSAGPSSDSLLDPPSKVTPFLLTASHRTATFRSDRARAPFWVSGGHLLFSECCCACGVARISLGIRLCVRRRCVSIFHFFLTFLKRACSPGAVKNSKISKSIKFPDVRKTNGKTMILRCPDVVSVILFFFRARELRKHLKQPPDTFCVCRRRLDFNVFCVQRLV